MRRIAHAFVVFMSLAIGAATSASAQDNVRLATLAPSALLWLHAIADAKGFLQGARHTGAGTTHREQSGPAAGGFEWQRRCGHLAGRCGDSCDRSGRTVIMSGAVLEKTILRLYGGPGVTSAKE